MLHRSFVSKNRDLLVKVFKTCNPNTGVLLRVESTFALRKQEDREGPATIYQTSSPLWHQSFV